MIYSKQKPPCSLSLDPPTSIHLCRHLSFCPPPPRPASYPIPSRLAFLSFPHSCNFHEPPPRCARPSDCASAPANRMKPKRTNNRTTGNGGRGAATGDHVNGKIESSHLYATTDYSRDKSLPFLRQDFRPHFFSPCSSYPLYIWAVLRRRRKATTLDSGTNVPESYLLLYRVFANSPLNSPLKPVLLDIITRPSLCSLGS